MRILLVRNAWQGDFGGAETYALNTATVLAELDHQPILVTRVPELTRRARENNIKVIRGPWFEHQDWSLFPALWRPIIIPAWYALVCLWYTQLILRRRIDIIHAQSRDDFVAATWAGLLTRRSVVWTDHADLKHVLQPGGFNTLRRLVLRSARWAKAIIEVSESEKREVLTVAPGLELTVIHNGVIVPEVHPVEQKSDLIVGTAGRLTRAKGVEELIRAFAASKHKGAALWLVGDGPDRSEFEQLVSDLGVERSVKFWGHQAAPLDYVASMDVFAQASHSEGFSLAIVEAAMLGRAIVASNVGGTPEIINDKTGILVPPKDVAALTVAINRLIEDKSERRKLGQAAKALAERDFDFRSIVAKRLVPLYNHAMGGRREDLA